MGMMLPFRALAGLFAALILAGSPASASAQSKPALLLELFTSQGCYSCPPAEELLAHRYLNRPDVLAIELHVDYWDDLVYRGSSWADPYSSPLFTQRQYGYATAFRGPFTPQAVVQGAYSSNGANADRIDFALSEVGGIDLTAGWEIELAQAADGSWDAHVRSAGGEADVAVVQFLRQATTEVTRGENKGKTLVNHNIVTSLVSHGQPEAGDSFKLGVSDELQGCALIVQRPDQGVVLGAWRCPGGPVS